MTTSPRNEYERVCLERNALRDEAEELKAAIVELGETIKEGLVALRRVREERDALEAECAELRRRVEELEGLLDTPETEDFDRGVPLEAAHQVKRWGVEHDEGKAPADWFWLIGYLAGKGLAAALAGNAEKAKHHCISTAAVLRNWHAHLTRPGAFQPGHAPSAARAAEKEGSGE